MGVAPHREMRRLLHSVCRRSAFLSSLRGKRAFTPVFNAATKQSRLRAADPGLLRRFAPRNDDVYPRMIVMAAGSTTGAV